MCLWLFVLVCAHVKTKPVGILVYRYENTYILYAKESRTLALS